VDTGAEQFFFFQVVTYPKLRVTINKQKKMRTTASLLHVSASHAVGLGMNYVFGPRMTTTQDDTIQTQDILQTFKWLTVLLQQPIKARDKKFDVHRPTCKVSNNQPMKWALPLVKPRGTKFNGKGKSKAVRVHAMEGAEHKTS
jgi:hypothetical protein